jgi:hypothetical protein
MHKKFQKRIAFLILLFFVNLLFGQEKEIPKKEEPKEKQGVSIIKFIPKISPVRANVQI